MKLYFILLAFLLGQIVTEHIRHRHHKQFYESDLEYEAASNNVQSSWSYQPIPQVQKKAAQNPRLHGARQPQPGETLVTSEITESPLPFGPLPSGSYKIAPPSGNGVLPSQNNYVQHGYHKSDGQEKHAQTGQHGGFGNNIPHYMVVDNKYAGVKLKDPIHVKSLNYFDESRPSVDGIQTAEEVKQTQQMQQVHQSPTATYYSPTEGILADPTVCLSIKNPHQCVSNRTCGWCDASQSCISGTFKGPAKNSQCAAGYAYGQYPALPQNQSHPFKWQEIQTKRLRRLRRLRKLRLRLRK